MAQEKNTTDGASSEVEDELPALQQDQDAMMWSKNEDDETPGTPPPHIAARFYRSATNRRRPSAASSRRNSLSSTHSHHSSRSYRRSSCHSNYVDQHLRRASILESRRARLADKAAHAEQVRLRAAQAKAAPKASNSEEKAQAAKEAREKYLAKVASACAEEVNRAKRVAEEVKERWAAEEKRYRQELEEKHAEAERRRLEYRKTPRRARASTVTADGKKATEVLKSSIDQDTAVSRIQRAWRKHRRRKVVTNFQNLDISIDRLRQIEFAAATDLLASTDTINITRYVLSSFNLLDLTSDDDMTPVRTFLSAFMILGHPTEIFDRNGQQEQDLIGKAKDLLISFESILYKIVNSPFATATPTQLETLSQAHATYLTAFAAWKAKDATILIDTMIAQFVELDAIWQTVKDDTRGEVANDYRDGIRENQVILLSKIKRLAGPERGNQLIKKAIRENRRQRNRNPPAGQVRPRPLTPSDQDPSPTASSLDSVEETQPDTQRFELTQLSRLFSIVPSNRVVIHELLINPHHKISINPKSDMRTALNREVCDNMRRGFEQGHSEAWTVAVAENIRARVLKHLKPGNSTYRLFNEVLDIEHIRTQCRHGQFSYANFFNFMADILPKLCAPIRDTEINAIAQSLKAPADTTDAMIEKLFSLLHAIDQLSLDYTNYMIRQAAPTLISEGPRYEARQFQADLDRGSITLSRTKRWWRNASVNVLTEANNTDPTPISRPSFTKIYARGLTDLVFVPHSFPKSEVPEPLTMDIARLSQLRVYLYRYVFVGGALLTAKNLLKRDVRSHWKPEAKRIADSLQAREDSFADSDGEFCARVMAIIESSHGMPPSSREHLVSTIKRFLSQLHSAQISDPVLKLLLQRLKAHHFKRLTAVSSAERVRIASTASEALGAIGLGEFIVQLGWIAEELGKVMSVDLAGHREFYEKIAAEMEELGSNEAGDA